MRINNTCDADVKKGLIFQSITERKLLGRLKILCSQCNFDNPKQYKLHSFRHHFASLCANHNVAYKKALAWLGHSNSDMLDLYYHLHDADSQQAMMALATADEELSEDAPFEKPENQEIPKNTFEDKMRTKSEYETEKTPQTLAMQELVECLNNEPERGGFEPPVPV